MSHWFWEKIRFEKTKTMAIEKFHQFTCVNYKKNEFNDNNNNNNNNNNPRDQEILGWYLVGDSLISWGERSSLALVGNPSRVGVEAP